MLALTRMDWTLNRRLLWQLTPLWLMYGGQILFTGPQGMIAACVMFSGVMGLLLMFSELGSPIMPFVCALPVSRSRIVIARYITALITLAIGLVIPILLGLLAKRLGWGVWHGMEHLEDVPAVFVTDVPAVLMLIALAFSAVIFIYLPFHFRFGVERGLQVFIILVIVSLVPSVWISGWNGVQRLHELGGAFLDHPLWHTEGTLVVLSLGGVSLLLSIQGFKRRSF